MTRHHTSILTALLLVCILPVSASAAWWNPIDWFRTDAKADFSTPTSEEVAAAQLLLERAEANWENHRTGAALRDLRRIHLDYSNTPQAPDAYLLAGHIEFERGRLTRAFRQYQRIISRYPGHDAFDTVLARQWEIADLHMDGARSRLLWVLPGFRQPRTAMEQFEVILRNAPHSAYAPQALMNIGMLAQSLGDDEKAIDALDRLISFYPRSPLTETAYFMLAQVVASLIDGAEYDQGTTMQAMNYYQDFLVLFPNSEFVAEAEAGLSSTEEIFAHSKLLMGEFYYVYRSDDRAARLFYNEVISVVPDSKAADFARKRLRAIEEDKRRPFLSRPPSLDRPYDRVDEFFEAQWELRRQQEG